MQGDYYKHPFRMVEPPPPPAQRYFAPKRSEDWVQPRPPKRRHVVPRPAGYQHRASDRERRRVKRAAATAEHAYYAGTPPAASGRNSPVLGWDACTASAFGAGDKLKPPNTVRPQTAPLYRLPRAQSPSSECPDTWTPTGFDFIDTALTRLLKRISTNPDPYNATAEDPDAPGASLSLKWKYIADLLQQYGAREDAAVKADGLRAFLDQQVAASGQDGLFNTSSGIAFGLDDACPTAAAQYAYRPTQDLTGAAWVVVDQLLLLTKRLQPQLSDLVMQARYLLLHACYVVPKSEPDIVPLDNASDSFEVAEQVERFNAKTYFQATRELSLRLSNDAHAFEDEEVTREKQTACIGRIILHWQREFRGLLFKAWRRHVAHQREVKARDAVEATLRAEVERANARAREREQEAAALKEGLKALQDGSVAEKKLKAAVLENKRLERELKAATESAVDASDRLTTVAASASACLQTVLDSQAAVQPPGLPEYRLQAAISDDFLAGAASMPLDELLAQLFTTVAAAHVAAHRPPETPPTPPLLFDARPKKAGAPRRSRGEAAPRESRGASFFAAAEPPPPPPPPPAAAGIAADEVPLPVRASVFDAGGKELLNVYAVVLHAIDPEPRGGVAALNGVLRADPSEKAAAVVAHALALGIDAGVLPQELEFPHARVQHLAFSCQVAARLCDPKHARGPAAAAFSPLGGPGGQPHESSSDAIGVLFELKEELSKLADVQARASSWTRLALSLLAGNVRAAVERVVGRSPALFSVVESSDYADFCDPHAIGCGVDATGDAKQLALLETVLGNSYRLMRRLFYANAGPDVPAAAPAACLWRLLEEAEVPKAFSMSKHEFDALVGRAVARKPAPAGQGPAPAAGLSPAEWTAVVVHCAAVLFRDSTPMMIHEKVSWLLERHLLCTPSAADASEYRELIYHTSAQAVLAEYAVPLRAVFDQYTVNRTRISANAFMQMLNDAGLFATQLEAAQRQFDGRLHSSVCRDVFSVIKEASGSHAQGGVNFTCFLEVLAATSAYDARAQPYLPLHRAVRRFFERRLLKGLTPVVPSLQALLSTSSGRGTSDERKPLKCYRLAAFSPQTPLSTRQHPAAPSPFLHPSPPP
ncbi:hypothetical protein DIPPA_24590 [Diplonema papillatum]|nr:hypothetical protein DIPPA_24590 [Diplonema papillatum]